MCICDIDGIICEKAKLQKLESGTRKSQRSYNYVSGLDRSNRSPNASKQAEPYRFHKGHAVIAHRQVTRQPSPTLLRKNLVIAFAGASAGPVAAPRFLPFVPDAETFVLSAAGGLCAGLPQLNRAARSAHSPCSRCDRWPRCAALAPPASARPAAIAAASPSSSSGPPCAAATLDCSVGPSAAAWAAGA
eukprot:2506551-Prymnesium_polylepis.2